MTMNTFSLRDFFLKGFSETALCCVQLRKVGLEKRLFQPKCNLSFPESKSNLDMKK